jgi:hypothetical protein
MRASAIAYSAVKDGSATAEYEDAFQILPGTGDEVPGDWVGVAVADGATESLLARQWATMLADEFAGVPSAARDSNAFAETVSQLSAQWPNLLESYLTERRNAARPLRWYERPGIEKGAFATLLTFQLSIDDEIAANSSSEAESCRLAVIGSWHSAAVGDTCLFHVRSGRLKVAFPLGASAHFDTSPSLLGSFNDGLEVINDHIQFAEGIVAEGDDFFVCTDALAAWFLARVEEGGRPWEALRDLSDTEFPEWITTARRTQGLRNDDVTLVHVDIW